MVHKDSYRFHDLLLWLFFVLQSSDHIEQPSDATSTDLFPWFQTLWINITFTAS